MCSASNVGGSSLQYDVSRIQCRVIEFGFMGIFLRSLGKLNHNPSMYQQLIEECNSILLNLPLTYSVMALDALIATVKVEMAVGNSGSIMNTLRQRQTALQLARDPTPQIIDNRHRTRH